MGTVARTVSNLIEPIVEQEGLELVDITFSKEGGRFFLRIFIDKPTGVKIDDCERVSTRLSTLLDEHDPIPHSYVLEVSSPGLDRPLKRSRDYDRFKGRKIKISTYAPIKGQRRLTGTLLGLKEDQVELKLEDGNVISIPHRGIAQARLVADFDWEGIK